MIEFEEKLKLTKEFKKDTGLMPGINKDEYIKWIEHRLVKLFAIPVVSKAERELFVDMIEKMNELDWEECDNGFAARVFDRLNGNK